MTESFGNLLRRLRLATGLSQEQLAERAALTAAAVGALERGDRRHPYPHTVAALAEALDLTPAQRRQLLDAVPPRGVVRQRDGGPADGSSPLPVPLTPLVGRAHELALITSLLGEPGARWVTLTGTGGIGKTRLAIEAASRLRDQFPDGVVWVDLSQVRERDLVAPAIARALGLPEDAEGRTDVLVARFLGARHLLLLLDNLEQIADEAPAMLGLIERARAVAVLATSRGALRIRGEHEVAVLPLALPDAAAPGPPATDAMFVFVQRARAVLPSFEPGEQAQQVAAICRQLEGIPLALELAAAQLRYTSLDALQEQLQDRLSPLQGAMPDLPPRQRSLRASVQWSYDLLSGRDRDVFARAAVFEGGFTMVAARAVCGGTGTVAGSVEDAVASLVDRSLITVTRPPGHAARFDMLETLRTFALERLDENGERPQIAARHRDYYCELAEEAARHLAGAGREPWLATLDGEARNINAALGRAEHVGDAVTQMRLVAALGWFWIMRARFAEGNRWASSALRADSGDSSPSVSAGVRYTAAALAWKGNDLVRARALVDDSVALARAGERRQLALALALSGLIAISEARAEAALCVLEESLAIFVSADDAWGIAYARSNLGDALLRLADRDTAGTHYRASLDGFRSIGDPWGQAIVLHMLGSLARDAGDLEAARDCFRESVDLCRRIGNRENTARGLIGLAAVELQSDDVDAAEECLRESLDILDDIGMAGAGAAVRGLAAVCAVRGEFREAAALLGAAEAADAGGPLFMIDPGLFDEQARATLAALGPAAFSDASEAGRAGYPGSVSPVGKRRPTAS